MEHENRIKKLRQERGLSVQELADMIGKNRATVYRYENGDIENMSSKAMHDLASVLNTTPMYLMGVYDDPYDYEEDPDSILSEVPDSFRREMLNQGKSVREIYNAWQGIEPSASEERPIEPPTSAITDDQIKAAFFNGADPTLTKEEQDAMWDEAKAFIDFKIQQRKRKENQ